MAAKGKSVSGSPDFTSDHGALWGGMGFPYRKSALGLAPYRLGLGFRNTAGMVSCLGKGPELKTEARRA